MSNTEKLTEEQRRSLTMMLDKEHGKLQYDKILKDVKVLPHSDTELHIEIHTEDIIDVFSLFVVKLEDGILPFETNVAIKYVHTRDIGQDGEDSCSYCNKKVLGHVVDKFGRRYTMVELPCVRYLLEDENENIVNHTMGVPFDFHLGQMNYIYTKTVHEDNHCDKTKELVHLFFGPINASLEILKDNGNYRINRK